jgi:hypothetical protein
LPNYCHDGDGFFGAWLRRRISDALRLIQALKNIEGDRSILHVLADEVAYVFARRRVDVLVARALVNVASQLIG